MGVKQRSMMLVSIAVLTVTGGVLAATALRMQPADDPLPAGFSRDANTGALLVTSPPGVQYESDARSADVTSLTSGLSVGELSLDESGYVKAFTLNSRLGDHPDGTELICRSVTLNADGTLDSLELAEDAADTGCDMTVVMDGGVTSFRCRKTTCTTVGDVQHTTDPTSGEITITCNCRATP